MSGKRPLTALVVMSLGAWLIANGHSRAEDPDLEWLLQQATTLPTQPATHPTTQPAQVLHKKGSIAGRKGTITLSDGTVLEGGLSTTPEKPVRVFDGKAYQDLPFSMIQRIEVHVLWERDEREWRFKESGSDLKEYSGKTYPARELSYRFTLKNGTSVQGGVVAPIYLDDNGETTTYVLSKRTKGEVGQSLSQLVHVSKIELE